MAEKTNWRKHNDSRYISGDDLKSSFNGLKPEMTVVIIGFEDSPTFDANTGTKDVKTGLYLQELNGAKVYKPLILNKTNGKFCAKEFKSEYLEDWLNLPVTLYAALDSRHGFVARFKKYNPPPKTTDVRALEMLKLCKSLSALTDCWTNVLSAEEKNFPTVIALKEKLKTDLKGIE